MNFHTRRQKRGSSSKVVHSYFIDEDGCNASSSGGRECSQMTSHSFSPDPEEIGTWVYPTNFPVRKYQQDICESALFHNTLVCLPTGLGKTLIASVVMYNYFRWFPDGVIVFMAPTRPLVMQQIEACHSVTGIPENMTAHLDGETPKISRRGLWESRRVVYCTPQTFRNDLRDEVVNPHKIVCLVFDEAHKAVGQYAYTQIMKTMCEYTDAFRVLALSATPGSKKRDIQNVIDNLRITKIEVRSEEDDDVAQYINMKLVEIVKCKIGPLNAKQSLRDQLLDFIKPSLLELYDAKLIYTPDPTNMHTSILDEAFHKYRNLKATHSQSSSPMRSGQTVSSSGSSIHLDKDIVDHFNIIKYILFAKQALQISGPYKCIEALDNFLVHREDAKMPLLHRNIKHDKEFKRVYDVIKKYVANKEYVETVNPKVEQLLQCLQSHFSRHYLAGSMDTRAIVFAQLRSTVVNIVENIDGVGHIKAHQFVGQSETSTGLIGMDQTEQARIMNLFKSGEVNVLVATSIAEEGLDVGEVDLCVFFDGVGSPIRLVQRMGRTGRKRIGKVVMLVNEGKEEKKLEGGDDASKAIDKLLRNPSNFRLYRMNPKVLPHDCNPMMTLENIVVNEEFHYSQIEGHREKNKHNATTSRQTSSSTTHFDQSNRHSDGSLSSSRISNHNHSNMRTLEQIWNSSAARNVNDKAAYGDVNDDDVDESFRIQPMGATERAGLGIKPHVVLDDGASIGNDDVPIEDAPLSPEPFYHLTPDLPDYNDAYLPDIDDSSSCENLVQNERNVVPSEVQDMYNCKFKDEAYLELKNKLNAIRDEDMWNAIPQTKQSMSKLSFDSVFSSSVIMSKIRQRTQRATFSIPSIAQEPLMKVNSKTIDGDAMNKDTKESHGLIVATTEEMVSNANKNGVIKKPLEPSTSLTSKVDKTPTASVNSGSHVVLATVADAGRQHDHEFEVAVDDDEEEEEEEEKEDQSINEVGNIETKKEENRHEIVIGMDDNLHGKEDEIVQLDFSTQLALASPSPQTTAAPVIQRSDISSLNSSSMKLSKVESDGDISHDRNVSVTTPFQVNLESSSSSSSSSEKEEDSSDSDCEEEIEMSNTVDVSKGIKLSNNSTEKPPLPKRPKQATIPVDTPTIPSILEGQVKQVVKLNTGRIVEIGKNPFGASSEDNTPRSSSQYDSYANYDDFFVESTPQPDRVDVHGQDINTRRLNGNSKEILMVPSNNSTLIPFRPPHQDARAVSTKTFEKIPNGMVEANKDLVKESEEEQPGASQTENIYDSPCCVCSDVDASEANPMVFCEGRCGQWTHISCYGLEQLPKEGQAWVCESCEHAPADQICYVCRKAGGMMKLSVCKKWVHPICVMFTSELTVNNDMRACNLEALDPDRKILVCMVCRDRVGSSVQCSEPDCLVSAHACCALKSDFQMTVRLANSRNGDDCNLQCNIYCFLHFNKYINDDTLISCRDRNYLEYLEGRKATENKRGEVGEVKEIVRASPLSQVFAETPIFDRKKGVVGDRKKMLKRLRQNTNSNVPSINMSSPLPVESRGQQEKAERRKKREERRMKKAIAISKSEEKVLRRQRRMGIRCIETHAELSGSDSGDEIIDGKESPLLSGDFINDGEYTQASSDGEHSIGLYNRVNKQLDETPEGSFIDSQSPAARVNFNFKLRGMENGLPNLQRLLEKERRRKRRGGKMPMKKKSKKEDTWELQRERENILPSSQDGEEEEVEFGDEEDGYFDNIHSRGKNDGRMYGDDGAEEEVVDGYDDNDGRFSAGCHTPMLRYNQNRVALEESPMMRSDSNSMGAFASAEKKETLYSCENDECNSTVIFDEDDW